LTVDEFLAWSDTTPGRFELFHGTVYEMQSERAIHAAVKYRVQKALDAGLSGSGCECHMLPDGMTVRINKDTAYEPDALVYCGDKVPDDAIEVRAPVIVVEVSSPFTRRVDAGVKLAGYFSLPSVQHYIIVDPERLPLILHSRQADGSIQTRLLAGGHIRLSPPDIDFDVDGIVG
jgi:Uma2 family endonuclease